MEFNNNFYVIVIETATDRGAFELLIELFTGFVIPEVCTIMIRNVKYGHMSSGQMVENTLPIEKPFLQGQQYLEVNLAGAELESDGTSFYGDYTLDHKANDQVAGMLSANVFDSSVWLIPGTDNLLQDRKASETVIDRRNKGHTCFL